MQMAMEPDSEPVVVVPPPADPVAPAIVRLRPSGPGSDPGPGLPRTSPKAPPPPGALAVLGHGARRVLGQPRLLFLVWGLSMMTAMAASLPAVVTLSILLGKRPAATLLARGQADALFGELLADHPVSIAIILGSVLTAAGLFFLCHLALSGGLLSALRRPGHPQRIGPAVSQIVARGLASTGAMIRLELLFLLAVRIPLTIGCLGSLAVAGRSKFTDTHTVPEILWRLGPLAGLSLVLWCAGTIVLYAARLARLGQTAGDHSSRRALAEGILRTLGSFAVARVTLTLAGCAALGMVGLVVLGRVLAARLDYALLIIAALVVRQGFALLRSVLTLTVMAGTVELCDSVNLPGNLPGNPSG